jgi:hypothetical protein
MTYKNTRISENKFIINELIRKLIFNSRIYCSNPFRNNIHSSVSFVHMADVLAIYRARKIILQLIFRIYIFLSR